MPWNRKRRERELREELDLHLRLDVAERMRRGEADAEAAAAREFGNRLLVAEAVRRQWGWEWFHSVGQDIRFGFRNMRRNPAFAATAVLTLAAGIGAATTMFSVIYGVLLHPFPYKDADRLVLISVFNQDRPGEPGRRRVVSAQEARAYRGETTVFEGLVSSKPDFVNLRYGGYNRPATVVSVSGNTFGFIGIPAKLGRPLLESDANASAPPVAVISEGVWMSLYGGDPRIVGRSVVVGDIVRTIVGVIPKRYAWFQGEFWVPMKPGDGDRVYLQGRLKPGVRIEQANLELTLIGQRLKRIYPREYPDRFDVRGVYCLDDLVGGAFRRTLYIISGAVVLLLLIACSNVANLLLARAAARTREIGVRLALGAGRFRIIRQLLAENIALALLGGVAGCIFAYAGVRGLQAVLPVGTFADESVVAINVPVLLFSLCSSLSTIFLFGLAPAWQLAREQRADALRSSSQTTGDEGRGLWISEVFVGAQVALAVVLTIGAGLLLHSFVQMLRTNLRADPGKIAVGVPMPSSRAQMNFARIQMGLGRFERRMKSMPGVVAAGFTTSLPGQEAFGRTDVETRGSRTISATVGLDTAGVAEAAGYAPLIGRWISETDIAEKRTVAVVNRAFAQASSEGLLIVGSKIRMPKLFGPQMSYEVVGVVEDVSNDGLQKPVVPMVHLPGTGMALSWMMVRSSGDIQPILASLPKALAEVAPDLTLASLETLDTKLDRELGPHRFALAILSVFASVGLIMVTIGLYGSMSYAVSRRNYELGMRKALGAGGGDILRDVAGRGMRTVAAGAVAGTLGSLLASRLLAGQLGQVSRFDSVTYAATMLVVVVACAVGMAGPAWNAAQVDPARSLRHE